MNFHSYCCFLNGAALFLLNQATGLPSARNKVFVNASFFPMVDFLRHWGAEPVLSTENAPRLSQIAHAMVNSYLSDHLIPSKQTTVLRFLALKASL
ncbi:hypothetical protein GGS24DRAFT_365159 [Hypoxylon argillaceum]|nr:hypothetical protein GGS24DRAFT_365159 [Hypoxylon argillaceum]KAI1153108.1 hypothetical protein F4825DRAFT_278954 [Nemania diffusa]